MPSTTSTRLAAWAFGGVVLVGAVAIRWIGRDLWFDIDDWGFLAGRSGRELDDLLESWNQHWTTVPILAYRALWRAVGINHYWPYQALTIGAHLASACLLRLVMRRAGADPWLATAAATLFVFLGSGNENLVKAFQFTFAGSLAFGLAHLVLADHDGPVGRRDLVGLGCGLLGLMCSGISVAMVTVVGLAVLLRRGWRAAAVHTVPLALLYGAWWRGYRGDAADQIPSPTPGDALEFTVDLFVATFRGLGQLPGVGAALAVGGAVGFALLLRREGPAGIRGPLAAPVALAVGSVPLALSIAWGRAGLFGGPPPVAPRYVHLTAALLLPAVAVGLTELGRDRRPVLGLAIALLLVGVPGNVAEIDPEPAPFFDPVSEELVLTVASQAESSQADHVAAAAEHRVRSHHRRLAAGRAPRGAHPRPARRHLARARGARGPRPRRAAGRRRRRPDVHRRAGRGHRGRGGRPVAGAGTQHPRRPRGPRRRAREHRPVRTWRRVAPHDRARPAHPSPRPGGSRPTLPLTGGTMVRCPTAHGEYLPP